jgi:hypothetical protein
LPGLLSNPNQLKQSKMKKISVYIKVILLIGHITFTGAVSAQLEDNGNPPTHDTPIDGGLSILLAAGVAYGVKKMRDQRKKKLPKPDEE